MSGFTIVFDKKGTFKFPEKVNNALSLNKSNNLLEKKLNVTEQVVCYLHTLDKFNDDKLFALNNDYFVAFEGILFNKKDLTKGYGAYFDFIREISDNVGMLRDLRGEYSGSIYNRKNKKLIAFTNQTSSKPLFYFDSPFVFIISSEIKSITGLLSQNNIQLSLDEIGTMMLLSYGYLLDDYTIIKGVKKLKAGYFLEFDGESVKVIKYHEFVNNYVYKNKKFYIDTLDELFINAVNKEYLKDKEYNYKHIATLSGGLDSRMNVMIANKLGYKTTNFCASENNYLDEKISKRISSDLKNEYIFYSLNNGTFLYDIDTPVIANDGLVFYVGSAHILQGISKLNIQDFGLMHTGMLGDAVLGNYLKDKTIENLGVKNKKNLSFIKEVSADLMKKYDSMELFLLYNKGFNSILNGYFAINLFTEASSPFLDVEFLEFSLSIPNEYRKNEKIYREWIIKKHPNIAKYKWETTGLPVFFGPKVRYITRGSLFILNKLFKTSKFNYTMFPLKMWFLKNDEIKRNYDEYYKEKINIINDSKIKKIADEMFFSSNPYDKVLILTLLASIKLHNIS